MGKDGGRNQGDRNQGDRIQGGKNGMGMEEGDKIVWATIEGEIEGAEIK